MGPAPKFTVIRGGPGPEPTILTPPTRLPHQSATVQFGEGRPALKFPEVLLTPQALPCIPLLSSNLPLLTAHTHAHVLKTFPEILGLKAPRWKKPPYHQHPCPPPVRQGPATPVPGPQSHPSEESLYSLLAVSVVTDFKAQGRSWERRLLGNVVFYHHPGLGRGVPVWHIPDQWWAGASLC